MTCAAVALLNRGGWVAVKNTSAGEQLHSTGSSAAVVAGCRRNAAARRGRTWGQVLCGDHPPTPLRYQPALYAVPGHTLAGAPVQQLLAGHVMEVVRPMVLRSCYLL